MACLINKVVVNPRYKKIAPDTHFRLYHNELGLYPKQDYYINVDCGRCINCFRKYMSAWRFRLLHECLSLSPEQMSRTYFATLTIEPKFYTEKKLLLKKYVRQFLEHVRYKCKHSPRHFIVTERGEKRNRLHFHAIFFDAPFPRSLLHKLWKYGFVEVRLLNAPPYNVSQSISYCTSYVTKGKKGRIENVISPENFPLVLVSPGLGLHYLRKSPINHRQRGQLIPLTYDVNGVPRSLPRYLRNKVFTESELKFLKDDYFKNSSPDVIPEPPYYIGSREYTDYSVYLAECVNIKHQYKQIYGK